MNSKPIRIAQIMGKWVGGGVEAVVMNYYRNIDRNKIQFDFICDSDSTNIPYEEIEQLGGRVILCPPYQKIGKYHRELKRILKNGNYRIVHSHINTLSAFSLFAAKCANIPVRIAHSHATTNRKEFKRHILKIILRPFSRKFATHYMCCSEVAGVWQFGKKMYSENKVIKLNNAIDLKKFYYDKKVNENLRKELNISNDTCVIGNVGRLVKTKNQDFVIDIFNEFLNYNDNSVLLLVGQGPDLEHIRKKIVNLKIEEKVMLLGQRNDVYDIFKVFDIFLLPSLYEGLGMTLIEAQVSGLKCFASSNVPLESKICNNVEFLDLSKGAKAWAERIKCNLQYVRMSQKKSALKSGYDINNESKKLEKFYLDLYNEE